MHIDIVPNRSSRPAVLLRHSFREGKKVRKKTIANLSDLPMDQVEAIRRVLRGEKLAPVTKLFAITKSRLHGHVRAVLTTMRRVRLDRLIASRPSRERDLVMALVAARILEPEASKLETTRWWHSTTLPEEMGVADADEEDLYAAMDWVLAHQPFIERKLAQRHLHDTGLVLYDLTSSYFEGHTCPLAQLGHNRDGKKGKLQVNYGVLTDIRGRPVSVSVFEGSTGDPKTLLPQVRKLQEEFGIRHVALVGDRGMISNKQIASLEEDLYAGVHWVTALRSKAIGDLLEAGAIQLGLFDERNLFELTHPDYPGERLVVCRNPELARLRGETRRDLIEATERELRKVLGMVERGRLHGADKIGVRLGKVVNKYKVAKHFLLEIRDDHFSYCIDEERVAEETALDGIYVVRTSLPAEVLGTEDAVRSYKLLAQVERAFRTMKGIDLKVRPIRHHVEDRVRAHIFLCMLAYYVQWHMMEAWRPLLFADEDQEAKHTRDPVAPARRSDAALAKVHSHRLADGSQVHSFHSLLGSLQSIVRNACRRREAGEDEPTFDIDTDPDAHQSRAFQLLEGITA